MVLKNFWKCIALNDDCEPNVLLEYLKIDLLCLYVIIFFIIMMQWNVYETCLHYLHHVAGNLPPSVVTAASAVGSVADKTGDILCEVLKPIWSATVDYFVYCRQETVAGFWRWFSTFSPHLCPKCYFYESILRCLRHIKGRLPTRVVTTGTAVGSVVGKTGSVLGKLLKPFWYSTVEYLMKCGQEILDEYGGSSRTGGAITMSTRESTSHYWSCLSLSKDCAFISARDPYLRYFGLALFAIYLSIVLMIFFDLHFFWSLEKFHHQVQRCISSVKKRLRKLHSEQRNINNMQIRAERQLERSKEAKNIIAALRDAVTENDTRRLNILTSLVETVHRSAGHIEFQDTADGTGDHIFH